MGMYWELVKAIWRKIILRCSTGEVIRAFCARMGLVYIKFAQILATQNYGKIFTEDDRQKLSEICDNINPINFQEIEKILRLEYGKKLEEIFSSIEEKPAGSASISQVHRAKLHTGEIVAIKIKRQDVARRIKKDIKRLKKLVHRFGWIIKFGNFSGGDVALDLLLDWIRQETDFTNEQNNLLRYQEFAESVNGKIKDTVKIKVPKLYPQLCTQNVIVMEFIEAKTINQLELTVENKQKITRALNSYIKLSFWALLHHQPLVFHGDPHSGNIYVDDEGNIGFLDLGLIFALNADDSALILEFFLTVYAGNSEKIYDILVGYGVFTAQQKADFRADCIKYCEQTRTKNVTHYFTDMMNICLKYEFVPPTFLFCMAKAFVCLNGITIFTENKIEAHELLRAQVTEYLLHREVADCKQILVDGIKMAPRLISYAASGNLPEALSKSIASSKNLQNDLRTAEEHLMEALDLLFAAR